MDDKLEQLIRENERMKTALRNIRNYASDAIIGIWRQRVYDMAREGLRDAK